MMREFTAVLLLVLVASAMCAAAERPLTAHISGSTSLDVSNCATLGSGGPMRTGFSVFIENPLQQFMSIYYEYFDNSTNAWKDAGKLCNVPAGESMQCSGNMETTLGGKGNGTYTAEILRLTATSEAAPGDTFTAAFPYTVRHFVGDREQSLSVQKAVQDAALGAALMGCSGPPSCCNPASSSALAEASALLAAASTHLGSCSFTEMYSEIVSAEALISPVSASIANCTPGSGTPIPTPTPASSRTPSNSPTPGTVTECRLSLCDCACHPAGQTPEETGGGICGINCLEAYGVDGCRLENGACVEVFAASTPEPSETATPATSGTCPLGFALIVPILFAAWVSRRE